MRTIVHHDGPDHLGLWLNQDPDVCQPFDPEALLQVTTGVECEDCGMNANFGRHENKVTRGSDRRPAASTAPSALPRSSEITSRAKPSVAPQSGAATGSSRTGGGGSSPWQHHPAGPPPKGWLVANSKSTGKPYYYNPATSKSSYARPCGPPPKMRSSGTIESSSSDGQVSHVAQTANAVSGSQDDEDVELRQDNQASSFVGKSVDVDKSYARIRQQENEGTSSEYYGVSKHSTRWRATIKCEGEVKLMKMFDSESEAAQVWDAAARKHRGALAHGGSNGGSNGGRAAHTSWLNFPTAAEQAAAVNAGSAPNRKRSTPDSRSDDVADAPQRLHRKHKRPQQQERQAADSLVGRSVWEKFPGWEGRGTVKSRKPDGRYKIVFEDPDDYSEYTISESKTQMMLAAWEKRKSAVLSDDSATAVATRAAAASRSQNEAGSSDKRWRPRGEHMRAPKPVESRLVGSDGEWRWHASQNAAADNLNIDRYQLRRALSSIGSAMVVDGYQVRKCASDTAPVHDEDQSSDEQSLDDTGDSTNLSTAISCKTVMSTGSSSLVKKYVWKKFAGSWEGRGTVEGHSADGYKVQFEDPDDSSVYTYDKNHTQELVAAWETQKQKIEQKKRLEDRRRSEQKEEERRLQQAKREQLRLQREKEETNQREKEAGRLQRQEKENARKQHQKEKKKQQQRQQAKRIQLRRQAEREKLRQLREKEKTKQREKEAVRLQRQQREGEQQRQQGKNYRQQEAKQQAGGGAAAEYCEACGKRHDGEYMSGRFCGRACRKKLTREELEAHQVKQRVVFKTNIVARILALQQ